MSETMDCPVPAQAKGVTFHGADPNGAPTYRNSLPTRVQFQPRYIAVVRMTLKPNWQIEVNQASFEAAGTDAADREDQAINILRTGGRFRDLGDNRIFDRGGGITDARDFRHMYFRSQNEVFIFLDHPDVEVDPHLVMSFSELSAGGVRRDENYSFFNARSVTLSSSSGLAGRGQLIRVENWVTDEDGQPITSQRDYAMNIHCTVRNAVPGLGRIALIFDPDTGNGTGHKP